MPEMDSSNQVFTSSANALFCLEQLADFIFTLIASETSRGKEVEAGDVCIVDGNRRRHGLVQQDQVEKKSASCSNN